MRLHPLLATSARTGLAAGLLAGLSLAQGSNTCATAQPIAGFGQQPFSNIGASFDGTTCPMGADVWFAWTSPVTDNVTVSTCGLAGYDSYLAAFDGVSCPPTTQLACNDDSCGLQSTIVFPAVAGQSYLIEVGGWNGAQGSGSIDISQGGPTGGCANPAPGPDVIVGDVSGASTYGAIGGMSAYSLGTTSCNVGTAELNWIASNNQHPVIGQNIFRLNDGRFEQLGQSWLKHGFAALQGNLCCACISSGTGTRLGVGCSDPYGSGLNGSQSGLGPRSEVDAYSGAFLYPFGSQGQSGDVAYKRCQVPTVDVDPALYPNATYYGEAQYVAPDDAAAGNGANNVSWRPLTRAPFPAGGAFSLNTTSFTRRTETALMAWQEADPTVDVQAVDVPGEGRLWVASNCYLDPSAGTYRYEYCVANINSDRSVGRVIIPVGVGAQVTSMGMSFPHYHSGEPYTNLPWTATFLGDRVVFETEDFAANPDANALRWGTTYSFWFVSNNPPEAKTAVLGLFKPGAQADPTAPLCGPVGGQGAPIVVSYCSAAQNSTTQTGTIDAQNIDLQLRTLELVGDRLPSNVVAYSLASRTQDFVTNAGGSTGHLCVGGDIGRAAGGAILDTGTSGTLSEIVNLDHIPQPLAPAAVMAGDSWYFQFWHRDMIVGLGLSTSNFTNGVRVLFP